MFNELLDTASATTLANYSFNNGITVGKATIANSVAVTLGISRPLNAIDCNVVTVSGVKDLAGYNTMASTRLIIGMKAPLLTSGADNVVVIEAEDYDQNRSPGPLTPNNRWVLATSLPGYVGAGYMDSTPNIGANSGDNANTLGGASSMDYAVNFAAAGTYYIWARGSSHNDGNNNEISVNLDNVSQGTTARRIGGGTNNWGGDPSNVDRFGWVRFANAALLQAASVSVATPGVHIVTVVMREDGLRLDRFLFTSNTNYVPSANLNDAGPAATARSADVRPVLSIVKDAASNARITWAGLGWTLQGTTGLSNNPAQTLWQDLPYQSPVDVPAGYFGTGQTNVTFRVICK